MPVLYVASWDDASGRAEGTRTVYQLLLPRRRHADGTWAWDELEVRDSAIQGLGVYPRPCDAIDWADVRVPALLPYLGVESVVEDQHLHKCLLAVLHGDFTSLTVGELCARHGGTYRRNGICAVRVADARTDVSKKGTAAHAPLGDEERLLQIIEGGGSSACYVLEKDTREMLHLQPRPAAAACAATGGSSVTSSVRAKHGEAVPGSGAHGHLFEMLASHERLHHVDRNLATHVATIKRDEGWVIVNAHPALGDGLNLVGIINEPLARCKPTLKLVHRSVELLPDGAPELARLGLRQPLDAEEVWREATMPDDPDSTEPLAWRRAERMVVYLAQRRRYASEEELTVDYGRSYRREYASGENKPDKRFAAARAVAAAASDPAAFAAVHGAKAHDSFELGVTDEWPLSLRGWWSAHKQPLLRPAFRELRDGRVLLLDDTPAVVAAQHALATAHEQSREQSKALLLSASRGGSDKGGEAGPPSRGTRATPPPPRCHPRSRAFSSRRLFDPPEATPATPVPPPSAPATASFSAAPAKPTEAGAGPLDTPRTARGPSAASPAKRKREEYSGEALSTPSAAVLTPDARALKKGTARGLASPPSGGAGLGGFGFFAIAKHWRS